VTTTIPAAEKTGGNSGDHPGIVERMAQIQVFLPDELYAEVQGLGSRLDDILEDAVETAVRAELHRLQEIRANTKAYLAEIAAEVAEATAEEVAWAEGIVRGIEENAAAYRRSG
jgi:hypothetical protein